MKIGPRGANLRGLRLGRDPVVVIGIVVPFTPHGGRFPGKTLILESKCVCRRGNGLPAALLYASPRLKISMALFWFCRRAPGDGYPRKNLVLEKLGVKVQGGLGEVRNED